MLVMYMANTWLIIKLYEVYRIRNTLEENGQRVKVFEWTDRPVIV